MKIHGLKSYLIPSADPHQSEYVPEFWKRRQFMTGFAGSAGDAVVTLDQAGLWTDSRYFLQAERELGGSGFSLFRAGQPGVPSWQEWVAGTLSKGEALGVDPKLITHKNYDCLEKELSRRGIILKDRCQAICFTYGHPLQCPLNDVSDGGKAELLVKEGLDRDLVGRIENSRCSAAGIHRFHRQT